MITTSSTTVPESVALATLAFFFFLGGGGGGWGGTCAHTCTQIKLMFGSEFQLVSNHIISRI